MTEVVYFLYASETGNAESIAKQLHNRAITEHLDRFGAAPTVLTLNAFESSGVLKDRTAESAPLTLVIVCSTCGEGEVPENGAKFKRFLRNNKDTLHNVRHTMLALGDSNYNSFCGAGKHIDAKLEERGSRRFYVRGEADDAFGLDTVVDPWMKGLWAALFPGPTSTAVVSSQDAHSLSPLQKPLALAATVTDKAPLTSSQPTTVSGTEVLQIAAQTPVLLSLALPTVIVYSTDVPLAQAVAITLFETIMELGGGAAVLLPLTASVNLTRLAPQVLLFVGGVARSAFTGSVEAQPTLADVIRLSSPMAAQGWQLLMTWLRGASKLQHVQSLLVPETLDPSDAAKLRKCDKDLQEALQATKASELLPKLAPFSTAAGGSDLRRVAGCLEDLFRWTVALLDRLPGVVANTSTITELLDQKFTLLKLLALSGSSSSTLAPLSQGKSSKRNAQDPVRSMLSPLVFLHVGEGQHLVARVAHDLLDEAPKRGFEASITDLANFKAVGFPRRATFVMIVGGGAARNVAKTVSKMIKAVKGLANDVKKKQQQQQSSEEKKKAECTLLEGVKFALLGLDDKAASGERFNGHCMDLEVTLRKYGAMKIHATGLGDLNDEHLLSAIVTPWMNSLWAAMAVPRACTAYLDGGASSLSLEAMEGRNSWFPWESQPLRPEVASTTPVLFAYSSSGPAKIAALHCQKVAADMGFPATTHSLEKVVAMDEQLPRKVKFLILVVAGDAAGAVAVPRSVKRMIRFLKNTNHEADFLSTLQFAVLALQTTTSSSALPSKIAVDPTAARAPSMGTIHPRHPAMILSNALTYCQANRVFPITSLEHLSSVHTIGELWLCRVLATFTNLVVVPQATTAATESLHPYHTASDALATPPFGSRNVSARPSPMLGPSSSTLNIGSGVVRPTALFLYGSVTGNSSGIAQDLHREALELGFHSRVAPLNAFERMKFLSSSIVVIVCSTTCAVDGIGGGFPENSKRFIRYIQKPHHPTDLLAGLKFSVLALGSRKFADTFCFAGKEIDSRLSALGGERVCDVGLVDDQMDVEVPVEAWRRRLFSKLQMEAFFPPPLALSAASLSPNATVTEVPVLSSTPLHAPMDSTPLFAPSAADHRQPSSSVLLPAPTRSQKAKVLILYGSQKGNAESIALSLYDRLLKHEDHHCYDASVGCLNDFETKHWRKAMILLIVCSTTGEGEMPDNAIKFWRFLRQKAHPEDLLRGMKFSILGLGDTNYSRFCHAARVLDRRLEELGATRFYARGEADDAFGLENVVEPWIDNLWPTMYRTTAALRPLTADAMHGVGAVSAHSAATSERPVAVAPSDSSSTTNTELTVTSRLLKKSHGGHTTVPAVLSRCDRLTTVTNPENPDENHVVLFEFDVPPSLIWLPGDIIQVLPSNEEAEVQRILDRLQVHGEELFLPPTAPGVSSLFPGSPVYSRIAYPISNREVLTHVVSLRLHSTNKQIFSILLLNATDAAEQSLLASWIPAAGGPSGANKNRSPVTLLDLLKVCESSRPSFRHIVEHLMLLQPRSYSICSAKMANPTKLRICVKVVPFGVCTHWLLKQAERFRNGLRVEIPIALREKPEFRMPHDSLVPLILIGPGTGVAPFISFLEHRRALYLQQYGAEPLGSPSSPAALSPPTTPSTILTNNNSNLHLLAAQGGGGGHHLPSRPVNPFKGIVELFFGCRTSTNDFLFKEQLTSFEKDQTISTLHIAFSQEQNSGFFWYGGCYVQDKMQECSQFLCDLMVHKNAHVYVCGDAESMAKDVHRVLVDIVETHQQWKPEEALSYVSKMMEEGRYQRDIWTSIF